jgi:hypothetical protein
LDAFSANTLDEKVLFWLRQCVNIIQINNCARSI